MRIGADVGGTFTDVLALAEDGSVRFTKVLSTPPHYDRAVIDAAEQAREARADLIVTIGGGSITDGAKAAQAC